MFRIVHTSVNYYLFVLGGQTPYADNPNELLKEFVTLLEPNVQYNLLLTMDAVGLTTYSILSKEGLIIEEQYVQHNVTCPDNYFEGEVQGLYFGGTCRAPEDVIVIFSS